MIRNPIKLVDEKTAHVMVCKKYGIYIKMDVEDLDKLEDYSHLDYKNSISAKHKDTGKFVALSRLIMGVNGVPASEVRVLKVSMDSLDYRKDNLRLVYKKETTK